MNSVLRDAEFAVSRLREYGLLEKGSMYSVELRCLKG